MASAITVAAGFGLAFQSPEFAMGVFPRYISSKPETVTVMRNASKCIEVKGSNGVTLLHTLKKSTLFGFETSLLDISGQMLFKFQDQTASLEPEVKVKLGSGQQIMNAGKEDHQQVTAVFTNVVAASHASECFYIGPSDWASSDIFIRSRRAGEAYLGRIESEGSNHITGAVVAYIHTDRLVGRVVTIAPGVDMSLIVAICIAFDIKFKKDKENEVAAEVIAQLAGF